MTIWEWYDVALDNFILTEPQKTAILFFGDAALLRKLLDFLGIEAAVRQHDQQQVLMVRDEIAQIEQTAALCRAAIADGQQPREAPPAVPGRRVRDDVRRAVAEHQPRTDDQAEIEARLGHR